MTYSSLKTVQSSYSRNKTPQAAMAESHKVGCRWESGCAGTQGSLLFCLPCGSRTWCRHWGKQLSWFVPVCLSPQCVIIVVVGCLLEGLALPRRSNADITLALQDILVCVSYLCSHLSCFVQGFRWLPLLFAFSGCEFSGHGFLWCLCSARDVMTANEDNESLITLG